MVKVPLCTSYVLQVAQLSGNSMFQAHVLMLLKLIACQPKYRAHSADYGEIFFVPRSEYSTFQPNRATGGSRTGK
jgi:hypothetical protein